MVRGPVPSTDAPRREISTELVKKNRPFTTKPPLERAVQPSEVRKAKYFQQAKDDLDKWQPGIALDNMQFMGIGLLEMYLLAEEVGQARPQILRAFPKPGAKARKRYLPALAQSEAEENTDEQEHPEPS